MQLSEQQMGFLSSLKLRRPLVVFDLETTGTDISRDRIVEIAMIKVNPDGSIVSKPEKSGGEDRLLIDPERPIPAESSAVHGIYDSDVEGKPTFKQYAKSMFKFLMDCDLAGFNSNRFDVPFLAEEFLRAGIEFSVDDRNLIDVQNIFHKMEQRTLRAAYKFYCDKDLDGAHEALPDTEATLEILLAQLERYKAATTLDSHGEIVGPVPSDMDELAAFCERKKFADLAGRLIYDEEGEVCFGFGKHINRRVKDVLKAEAGYYGWMMRGDFPEYTKRKLQEVYESMRS
jgi:DNA polymerase-3 subunit epsilon